MNPTQPPATPTPGQRVWIEAAAVVWRPDGPAALNIAEGQYHCDICGEGRGGFVDLAAARNALADHISREHPSPAPPWLALLQGAREYGLVGPDEDVSTGEAVRRVLEAVGQARYVAKQYHDQAEQLDAELDRVRGDRVVSAVFGHHPGAPRPFALRAKGETKPRHLGTQWPDGFVVVQGPTGGAMPWRSANEMLAAFGDLEMIWLSDDFDALAEQEQREAALRAEVQRIADDLHDAWLASRERDVVLERYRDRVRAALDASAATAPPEAPQPPQGDECERCDHLGGSFCPECPEAALSAPQAADPAPVVAEGTPDGPGDADDERPAWYPVACEHGYDRCPQCDANLPIPPIADPRPAAMLRRVDFNLGDDPDGDNTADPAPVVAEGTPDGPGDADDGPDESLAMALADLDRVTAERDEVLAAADKPDEVAAYRKGRSDAAAALRHAAEREPWPLFEAIVEARRLQPKPSADMTPIAARLIDWAAEVAERGGVSA